MRVFRNSWFVGIAGLIFGALIVLAVRFGTYKTPSLDEVHYHANFAVYISGQRELFKAPNYYEEEAVATCSASTQPEESPMARVHLHDNVNDVVHVEDRLVTWGNFFTVLGWNVGGNYVATRNSIYQNNSSDQVTYILNGKDLNDIANKVIGDQDKLLVNYGSQSSTQIQQEYSGIKNNAKLADNSKDPAACGSHETTTTTFHDRLTNLL